MSDKLSVGIVVTSNTVGGVCKLAAMMANDLAGSGHDVSLYVPVLPFYYYFVTLRHRPMSWLKAMLPYANDWVRHHRFIFKEMLDHQHARGRISTKFVPMRASKGQLKKHDWLILNGISDVIEYRHRFPQDRQVYLVHNIPEYAHGNEDEFKRVRQSFRGGIVAISPFVARELSIHVPPPPVVANPISEGIWKQRQSFDLKGKRRDLLLYWKNNETGTLGKGIIQSLLSLRSNSTVTVWFRTGLGTTEAGVFDALPNIRYVKNLNETEVASILLEHSLLLFPQTFEEFGMPPVEALACGCIPVLHPNVGAAEMYARDMENSIYLSADPEESARRIRDVLDNPETLLSMRAAAPKTIAPFDPSRYGHRILEAAGFL